MRAASSRSLPKSSQPRLAEDRLAEARRYGDLTPAGSLIE